MLTSNLINYSSINDNNQYWLDRGYIPSDIKEKVAPYLLPYDHPARETLDTIYSQNMDDSQVDICRLGRKVHVIKHQALMELGLIIKEQYDTYKYSGLLRRVEAHKVAGVLIEEREINYVEIPRNWLYPIPVETDVWASFAYHIGKPIYAALKALSLHPPKWLKYGDSILINRFVVVEEHVTIKKVNSHHWTLLENVSNAVSDEWKEVFEAVGFRDAGELNYSLEEDGTITLFDLEEYSHKNEKNQRMGYQGINSLFSDRYPINY